MSDLRFRIRDEVAWRLMKEGTVTIVSAETEMMLSLNETAGFVWSRLDGAHTLRQIAQELAAQYPNGSPEKEAVERDVSAIIQSLLDRRLIEEFR